MISNTYQIIVLDTAYIGKRTGCLAS